MSVLLTFPFWKAVKNESWTVHMLDVGQGLAMVVERQGRPFYTIPGLHGRAAIVRSN
jgi:competence protein ComEC